MPITPRQQEELRSAVADVIVDHLEPLFDRRCSVSVVVRAPHLQDGDLIVSADELEDVIAALERLGAKPVIGARASFDEGGF